MSGKQLHLGSDLTDGEVSKADVVTQKKSDSTNSAVGQDDGVEQKLERSSGLEQLNIGFCDLTASSSKCWLQNPGVDVMKVEEPARGCASSMRLVPATKSVSSPAVRLYLEQDSEDSDKRFVETLKKDLVRQSVRYIRGKKIPPLCGVRPSSSAPLIKIPSTSTPPEPLQGREFPQESEHCLPKPQETSGICNDYELLTLKDKEELNKSYGIGYFEGLPIPKAICYPQPESWRTARDSENAMGELREDFMTRESSYATPSGLDTTDSYMFLNYTKARFNRSSFLFGSAEFKSSSQTKAFDWKNVKNKLKLPRSMPTFAQIRKRVPWSSKVDLSYLKPTTFKGVNFRGENSPRMKPWARGKQAVQPKEMFAEEGKSDDQGSARDKSTRKFGLDWVQRALTLKKKTEEIPEEKPVYPVDTYNTILDKEM